jgi:hypothetical protein
MAVFVAPAFTICASVKAKQRVSTPSPNSRVDSILPVPCGTRSPGRSVNRKHGQDRVDRLLGPVRHLNMAIEVGTLVDRELLGLDIAVNACARAQYDEF